MRATLGLWALVGVALLYAPPAGATRVVAQQQGTVTGVDSGTGRVEIDGHHYRIDPGVRVRGPGATSGRTALRPGMAIGFDATGGRQPTIREIWIRPKVQGAGSAAHAPAR